MHSPFETHKMRIHIVICRQCARSSVDNIWILDMSLVSVRKTAYVGDVTHLKFSPGGRFLFAGL